MYRLYKICGFIVGCDFRCPTMTARAEKFLLDGSTAPNGSTAPSSGAAPSGNSAPDGIIPASGATVDISIPYNAAALAELSARTGLDSDNAEIVFTAESFYSALPQRGGFMLHSSAVVADGRAYLFSAPSGTGKSTHTALWLKLFGERARILNDDKPAIMLRGGEVTACGTPWSGKSDLNLNAEFPLQGICILERSPENRIAPIPAQDAVFPLLDQTIRPNDPAGMSALLSCIDEVTAKVRVWRMGCNISLEAAQTAYNAMSRG